MKKQIKFTILIKSHTDYPDYEDYAYADKAIEAANIFYDRLNGEYDLDFIQKCMEEE